MLKIHNISIDKLSTDPNNARKHSSKNLDAIKGSLKSFGQQKPIVIDENHMIVAGNGTYEAAKALKWDTIDCVVTGLHGYEKTAFALADNKSAELAEWDSEVLSKTLEALKDDIDLSDLGFDLDELLGPKSGNIPDDEIPEVEQNIHNVVLGDIWQCGNHRLMCGDSTNKDQVDFLMGVEIASITFTSPPYNLGNNAKLRGYNGGGNDSAYNEKSDHKSQSEYLEFLDQFTSLCLKYSDVSFVNIQILAGNKNTIPRYWGIYQDNLIDVIIWDKVHAQPAAARRVLNSVWEFIFILTREQNPKRSIKTGKDFRGTIDNIYRLNPAGKKDSLAKDHGAVFPVEFAQTFIERHADKTVYEPFCGSGSTLIACEKTNRKCYGMEIDTHYCSVIIERWQQFTGQKAVKLETA